MRGSSSAGMPAPVSRHRHDDGVGRPGRRAFRRGRRRGVYLIALSSRLASTWRRRLRSTLDDELRCGRGLDARRRAPRPRPRTARRSAGSDRPDRVGSRRSAIVPVSASEMSISVLSIATTRSDSSRQSASASRSATGSSLRSAASAMPRSRVIGVRRSCATLSSAPRMPAITASMRSSMALTSALSSSSASPVFCAGHARLGPAGPQDVAHRVGETRSGCSAERGQDGAAGEADDDQREQVKISDAAEAVQELRRAARCSCRPGTARRRGRRTDATSSTAPPLSRSSVLQVCSPSGAGPTAATGRSRASPRAG